MQKTQMPFVIIVIIVSYSMLIQTAPLLKCTAYHF